MSFGPIITTSGIVAPSYANILASLKNQMRSIYGSDIYLEPDSQDGQMLAVFATAIKAQNDSVIAAYNSFSPATAQGVGLSTVVKINGIRRLVASNSVAVARVVGQVGTLIQRGQIADQAGVRWALPDEVEIPNEGQIDVTATAVEAGAISASPNTLTVIVTPTRGWQSVTNPAASTPGLPVETDATLRQRQSVSTQIPALSVIGAILGAIKNIIGVGRATVYENDASAPDGDGIPGHSISAVVEGGDVDTIAAAIARYKTPGTGTYGSTSVVVQDPVGVPNQINFYELALINVAVLADIDAETGYVSPTGDLICAALALYFNDLTIGQDSQLNKLWSPVNLTGDAATDSSGLTQQELDLLSNTYNAIDIYQARTDNMILTAPAAAGDDVVAVASASNYSNGKKVAIKLDNGDYLRTTVTNVAGLNITLDDAVPVGRTALVGAMLMVSGNIVIAFNEAVEGDVDSMTVEAS